ACRPASTPTPSSRSVIPWANSGLWAAARSPTSSMAIVGANRGAALPEAAFGRTMTNPVLVEVLRGALVESAHRGAVCVADADGATVLALGDVEQPVFPRSAVKGLQALPLVETGAAERYGLGDEELAIACGSHGGEPEHVAVAERMLARAGLDAAA